MRDGRETRELIARTALKLFADKGIRETTIRDIAAAAGRRARCTATSQARMT